jgi:hypothetical protein
MYVVTWIIIISKGKCYTSSQTETVFNDLLPDNDGVDDFLKSLDIPAQETCSNVPISKSMYQFPVHFCSRIQII